jgi:hypothetical protein
LVEFKSLPHQGRAFQSAMQDGQQQEVVMW